MTSDDGVGLPHQPCPGTGLHRSRPGARLRDIAAKVGVTERSVYAIVTDLAAAGYVVKDKDTDGRRNRYKIQAHLPLPGAMGQERTIGEVLEVLVDTKAAQPARRARR